MSIPSASLFLEQDEQGCPVFGDLSRDLPCGLTLSRRVRRSRLRSFDAIAKQLDVQRGMLWGSGVQSPGRYAPFQAALVNPPVQIMAQGKHVTLSALNERGQVILAALTVFLKAQDGIAIDRSSPTETQLKIPVAGAYQGPEEQRTRRPSVFSILRPILAAFSLTEDPLLGLYGLFGYDTAFALEDIPLVHSRPPGHADIILFLPDRLLFQPLEDGPIFELCYEFSGPVGSTQGLARSGDSFPLAEPNFSVLGCDHGQGQYASKVAEAKNFFSKGDLFELVLSQTFHRPATQKPSGLYRSLCAANPSPYQMLLNLGQGGHVISASPEMFVRVRGMGADHQDQLQVETSPISGTIARGHGAMGDADAVLQLLNSEKDRAELTMCTDVDRNDKGRVCLPGSIRLRGRRMLEFYSRLIHTVDHVTGLLRPDMDALDAFGTHTWAVTVTGAPKLHAMRMVEAMEETPRGWYGGAFGALFFDGTLDTGLTIRTMEIRDGVASVRAGATLLNDSDPDAEDTECRLKASALLGLFDQPSMDRPFDAVAARQAATKAVEIAGNPLILLVDHEDSFVLTLADYLRQAGASVLTLRPIPAREYLMGAHAVDMVVLSPGPGKPKDFTTHETLALVEKQRLPCFGVCLGLQAMIEAAGGTLGYRQLPMHGKDSAVHHSQSGIFHGLPSPLRAGRYHSIVAETVPDCYAVTATSDDGNVMAIAHKDLPWSAVQFHPESILTLETGLQMLINLLGPQPPIAVLRAS